MRIQCKTQAECDAALAEGNVPELVGSGWFEVRGASYVEAWESAHVEAWESAHVEAWESAHVVARESAHVEAWGSAHVVARESAHVVARESAHVVAWESAHVVARGSAHVEAWGSAHVEASKFVSVHKHQDTVSVKGGVVILVKAPSTPKEWCEFYGAKIESGIVMLYKAVRDDFRSAHGFLYAPGSTPEAPDWDGGITECGGGLHFSPSPAMALEFDSSATRFVACPVALKDIAVHKNPLYPEKIKARRIVRPVYEVDRYGERIET